MYKLLVRSVNNVRALINRLGYFIILPVIFISIQVFFILFDWLTKIIKPDQSKLLTVINDARTWLASHSLLIAIPGNLLKLLIVVVIFLFFPSVRSLIVFIFKKVWSFFKMLPGKQTKEMFRRYMNIGRFSFYQDQSGIFGRLKRQYPSGTGFVILPMDMEFMKAGPVKESYYQQMDQLAELKDNHPDIFFPFVFIDPRRIEHKTKGTYTDPKTNKATPFLIYKITAGKTELQECFVKTFIEGNKFSGFKIYPALGYYPFDERLLPLWKYAADNQIPILTHCIRGTIFYRGQKKHSWDYHPVYKQAMFRKNVIDPATGKVMTKTKQVKDPVTGELVTKIEKVTESDYQPLVLAERDNVDFSYNFTNPMNYLCLLEEEFLRQVIENAGETKDDLKILFGYTDKDTPLKYDLRHLKLCFGHFGGDDEWKRYFEQDRYDQSNQLTQHLKTGIDFTETAAGKPSPGKPEQLWKYTDWYSIICSMMLQYDHVYSDISYILHDDADIFPLLKETLRNPGLRTKVLYGTDFYVVRNHKSDKNMLADMYGGLSEEEFDMIARANPRRFLNLSVPTNGVDKETITVDKGLVKE